MTNFENLNFYWLFFAPAIFRRDKRTIFRNSRPRKISECNIHPKKWKFWWFSISRILVRKKRNFDINSPRNFQNCRNFRDYFWRFWDFEFHRAFLKKFRWPKISKILLFGPIYNTWKHFNNFFFQNSKISVFSGIKSEINHLRVVPLWFVSERFETVWIGWIPRTRFFPVEIFPNPNRDSDSVKNSESHDIHFLTWFPGNPTLELLIKICNCVGYTNMRGRFLL